MDIYFILWVIIQYYLIWLLTHIHFCPSSSFFMLRSNLLKKCASGHITPLLKILHCLPFALGMKSKNPEHDLHGSE